MLNVVEAVTANVSQVRTSNANDTSQVKALCLFPYILLFPYSEYGRARR